RIRVVTASSRVARATSEGCDNQADQDNPASAGLSFFCPPQNAGKTIRLAADAIWCRAAVECWDDTGRHRAYRSVSTYRRHRVVAIIGAIASGDAGREVMVD